MYYENMGLGVYFSCGITLCFILEPPGLGTDMHMYCENMELGLSRNIRTPEILGGTNTWTRGSGKGSGGFLRGIHIYFMTGHRISTC